MLFCGFLLDFCCFCCFLEVVVVVEMIAKVDVDVIVLTLMLVCSVGRC